MPTPTFRPAAPPASVLVSVSAGAARVAADFLALEARSVDGAATSDLLNRAASAMHAAGWGTAVDFDAARAELNREDVPRNTTIHLGDELARVLLELRGWTREDVRSSWAWVKPGGTRRRDGGQFGTDYLWDREEALALALTAEALEARS